MCTKLLNGYGLFFKTYSVEVYLMERWVAGDGKQISVAVFVSAKGFIGNQEQ